MRPRIVDVPADARYDVINGLRGKETDAGRVLALQRPVYGEFSKAMHS